MKFQRARTAARLSHSCKQRVPAPSLRLMLMMAATRTPTHLYQPWRLDSLCHIQPPLIKSGPKMKLNA